MTSPLQSNDEHFFHCFQSHNSEKPKDCMQIYKGGAHTNGNYMIHTDEEKFKVFCDFTSDKPFVWTLVHSFSLKNKDVVQAVSLLKDLAVDEDNPNWVKYRLSRKRMQWLRSQSTHWRVTCSFSTHGVDYRDYVRSSFTSVDPLSLLSISSCIKVCAD